MVKSGEEVFVLIQDLVEDKSTVRQSVDVFPSQDEARVALTKLAEEERPRLQAEKPSWKISQSDDFFEACDESDMYNNHYTIKVVKSVVH